MYDIYIRVSVIYHIPIILVITECNLNIFSLRPISAMDLRVLIVDSLQLSYCVICNNHTSCNLFFRTKTIVSISIYLFILGRNNEYIHSVLP